MTRAEVRIFIESGIEALTPVIQFGNGRITEFNSDRSKEYPFAWLESLKTSTTLVNSVPFDDWEVNIHIAKKDKADSSPTEYEAIVDECDMIAQSLVKKYNDVVTGYKLVELSGINREPFIKKHADETTGVILSFTLKAPDKTDVC